MLSMFELCPFSNYGCPDAYAVSLRRNSTEICIILVGGPRKPSCFPFALLRIAALVVALFSR